ncbi:uncharacterized protein METZ01_LOCUS453583, partial [marine metagenome]
VQVLILIVKELLLVDPKKRKGIKN